MSKTKHKDHISLIKVFQPKILFLLINNTTIFSYFIVFIVAGQGLGSQIYLALGFWYWSFNLMLFDNFLACDPRIIRRSSFLHLPLYLDPRIEGSMKYPPSVCREFYSGVALRTSCLFAWSQNVILLKK